MTTEDLGDSLPLVLPDDMLKSLQQLHPLQEKLLKAQIRKELAEAKSAELVLASKVDEERDRLVKAGRIRYLSIEGTIGGQSHEKWMAALRHWSVRDPGEPVTIEINSGGGSVTDGLAMYDLILRLREHGTHVTTRAVGMAASMAAVVLQAGTERLVDPHAKLLIHEGSGAMSGSRAELQDAQAFHDMLINDILDIIAERASISKRQIQNKWKRKDWWMSAAEAVKYGFADRVG